ncbi:MDR family MFS transporter [Microlunatus flavus]|uniref:MFS transporter, DHA2 family, lincomycin resistance protein n=1 Tax=Microlunatus flavus TaxID=1036181 RepID=A0A1H8ZWW7_9ACTN|nr:MDR family MFS transporter [Microlunatus flavus]SEP68864.1 MFS transporter, DHA2 family, lincomycin resistance protein [Microlunatus flavus]
MTATSTPTTTTGAASAPPADVSTRAVIAILLVATFVVILNETIMNVALPRLMEDLDVNARTGQWLATVFMLTLAVVIPTTGFLLQRLTTRQVFVTAMILFSTGTLLAAVSPAFWLLLPARVVQASGTAMMLPLLITTILTLVPVERRGVVMGNVTVVISVAPAIGPTVSGVVLHFFPWRFMFILVLPIALGALFFGVKRLVNVGTPGAAKLDVLSVVLTVPAFGGIVYGLSQLGAEGPGGIPPLAFVGVGALALLVFGWRQSRLYRSDNPLLDLRSFKFPAFSISVALLCAAMLALFGMVILLPIYLQQVRGIGALETGLMLLPGGLVMGLLGPQVGKLYDRYGPRGLTLFGSVVLVISMWRLSTIDLSTPIWMLIAIHVLLSIGLAFLFTPGFTTGLNPLPPRLYSHGSAILSTLQQVAGAAGTALLVAVYSGHAAAQQASGVGAVDAELSGIRTAFGVAALISISTVVLAAFMHNAKRPEGAEAPEGSAVAHH